MIENYLLLAGRGASSDGASKPAAGVSHA